MAKRPKTAAAEEPNTADRIAAVALEIFESEGPEAVTMRRVAKALGITPMAIYHHFTDRQALLQSLVYGELAKLLELQKRVTAASSKRNRLVRLSDSYLDYALQRPHMFDFVFTKPRKQDVRYPSGFRARRSPTLTPMADMISEAMGRGELKKDDVWEIAVQFWAHAHGYVPMYRAGWFEMSEKEFRAFYHRAVKRMLRGLSDAAG